MDRFAKCNIERSRDSTLQCSQFLLIGILGTDSPLKIGGEVIRRYFRRVDMLRYAKEVLQMFKMKENTFRSRHRLLYELPFNGDFKSTREKGHYVSSSEMRNCHMQV